MPYQQTLDRTLMFAGRAVLLLAAAAFLSACGHSNSSSSAPASVSGASDDFDAPMIDATTWANLEFVRQVDMDEMDNGVLELALRGFGSRGTNNLEFIDPDWVDSMQADVTVTDVINADASLRARLAGQFYNDGTRGDGATGDVFASTEIRHDGDKLVVVLQVFLCGDPDCNDGRELLFDTTTLGPPEEDKTHTLLLAYDGWETFTFGFDGTTATFNADRDTTPSVPRRGRARSPFKALQSAIRGTDGPTEGGFIAATFDNVMVNGSPYDDFESDRIDRTRWANFNLEFVRQVDNGVLESAVTRFGSNGGNTMNFVAAREITSFKADVTVTDIENDDAAPRARLVGSFYNDGTPGFGFAGEVLGGVEISHNGTELVGSSFVSRCITDACNLPGEFEDIHFQNTEFGSVALNETHILSIDFDGTTFTFGFDGSTVEVDPTSDASVAGPPREAFKGIGTRVDGINGPDEGAFIAATFDNVYFQSPRRQFDCPSEPSEDVVACLVRAIEAANDDDVPDIINLEAGPYTLMAFNNNANGPNGLPSITSPITIRGTGADPTIIERDPSAAPFRILHIAAGGDLTIDQLTIWGGNTGGAPGGGIYNQGMVTVNNSTVSKNSAGQGGGIWNRGMVTVNNSTVSDNSASLGGGLFNSSGQLVLDNSTVSNNSATILGGGILNNVTNGGELVLDNNSTVSNNMPDDLGEL